IGRAFGILANAHSISSKEAMNLLSLVRLAHDLKMFPGVPRALIDELMLSNLSGVASHVRHAARRRRRKLIRALPPAKAGE
ncbi:MAG TPA: hypothetical protein PKD61_39110, partial [Polyangiaceae bacterium]|nr:hypothetical protein [Polyangiaceae bacterium]